jgi:organic radical activating enzyme
MSDIANLSISKMRSPADMKIICVDITNRCNLGCSNCTRLLENQEGYWDMSLDNFRLAVRSLIDFPGIIAVIGGNPCMHRQFEDICKILVEEIPQKEKRGLWSNNVFKYVDLVVEVFGGFNLNPHGDKNGEMSLQEVYRRTGGIGNLYTGNSMHAPLLVAIKDLYGEEEMWSKISNCDINKYWSASIVQNNGRLRAYFCEVAASFDLARKTDYGLEVKPGWWRQNISSYTEQIKHFCPGCGAAARIEAIRDKEETDIYSLSNIDLVNISRKRNRKTIEISELGLNLQDKPITNYAKQQFSLRKKVRNKLKHLTSRFG